MLFRSFALLASLLTIPVTEAAKNKPQRKSTIGGYSSIVIDAATGKVLHEDNADAQKYPASLTKMMTLYMIFEALDAGKITLSTTWKVSSHAASMSPTKLGLDAGEIISVRDVILGLITKSANDAAATAAEGLGGSEDRFADMMTARARRLGMSNTTFQNASGLPDPGQVTTARDMVRLSRALVRDFPHFYSYFSTPEFTYAGRRHANHNRLMNWYEGADGIKTGYTRASGFNLVTSMRRGDRHVVAVVLGGTSGGARDARMRSLLETHIADAEPLKTTKIATTVPVTASEPVVAEAHVAKQAQSAPMLASSISTPVKLAAPAQDVPRSGSSEPLKPVAVKTVAVKVAADRKSTRLNSSHT